jgi:hypothetical protein
MLKPYISLIITTNSISSNPSDFATDLESVIASSE